MNQRMDIMADQLVAALEKIEFDDEGQSGDGSAHPPDELGDGDSGSSGCEHVVDDQDALAGRDGVLVDFEGVSAVFEGIFDALDGGGELLWLADRHEPGADGVGDRGGEEESASLDAEDLIDTGSGVAGLQGVEDASEAGGVLEEGGDVVS